MAKDFIPKNHDEFKTKLEQFEAWLVANGPAKGVAAGKITAFSNAKNKVVTDLTAKRSADTVALAANQTLEQSEDAARDLWRPLAKSLQAGDLTDDERVEAALTVPKRTRTRRQVGADIPNVKVELVPGQVIVHWGTNPANEAKNKKPAWAEGVNIYLSVNNGAEFLAGFDRASPFEYNVMGPPISLTIRVAYRGPGDNQIGTKSPPVTVATGG